MLCVPDIKPHSTLTTSSRRQIPPGGAPETWQNKERIKITASAARLHLSLSGLVLGALVLLCHIMFGAFDFSRPAFLRALVSKCEKRKKHISEKCLNRGCCGDVGPPGKGGCPKFDPKDIDPNRGRWGHVR